MSNSPALPDLEVEDPGSPIDVVALDGQEVVVQSGSAVRKRYRPLREKSPDEYRRHRDRNNLAVRKCRERHNQRNRDRVAEIETLKAERGHLTDQIEQLLESNRALQDDLRRVAEEKAALQAEMCRQLTVRKRLEDHSKSMEKVLRDHNIRISTPQPISTESGLSRVSLAKTSPSCPTPSSTSCSEQSPPIVFPPTSTTTVESHRRSSGVPFEGAGGEHYNMLGVAEVVQVQLHPGNLIAAHPPHPPSLHPAE